MSKRKWTSEELVSSDEFQRLVTEIGVKLTKAFKAGKRTGSHAEDDVQLGVIFDTHVLELFKRLKLFGVSEAVLVETEVKAWLIKVVIEELGEKGSPFIT